MQDTANTPAQTARALTPLSVGVSLLVILLSGVLMHFVAVLDHTNNACGNEALAIPVMVVFLPVLAAVAAVAALARVRLLSRAELLCVLFSALIATPLMGLAFWRFQFSAYQTVPRLQDWVKMEALPDALWPHGANLLEGVESRPVLWQSIRGRAHLEADRLTITPEVAGGDASVRLRFELTAEASAQEQAEAAGRLAVRAGRPVLFTALVRPSGGAEANYFVRVYADGQRDYAFEPLSGRVEAKPSPLLPDGFVRIGYYGLRWPEAAVGSVDLELGARGGAVEWRDLRLCDVQAIEAGIQGYKRVSAEEYATLTPSERADVVVMPRSLFSGAGLRFLLGADYPLGQWVAPVLRLAVFAALSFALTFGLALIYRRQWLQNERYPLPLGRFPLVLLGAEESQGGLGERFWANRWLWLGFGCAFAWCLLKVARGYNPGLPDVSVNIGLKAYLADAFWGRTWDGVELQVFAMFLGIGLLMELNVLLSLVVGYFFFRLQHWAGTAQGVSADQDFPYYDHQILGAWLAYAAAVLFFSRRHLRSSLGMAWKGGWTDPEAGPHRWGWLLLVASAAGVFLWARWVGLPGTGLMVGFACVGACCFVAMKLRAECGLPYIGFNHAPAAAQSSDALLLVPLLGGFAFFGGPTVMVLTLLSATLVSWSFFYIGGLQLELVELGRRLQVRRSHVAGTVALGFLAAIFIGGFVYFHSLYGYGAGKYPNIAEWSDRVGAFRVFNSEYSRASAEQQAVRAGGEAAGGVDSGRVWALGLGAGGATAVSVLRQALPGFWFHPIGFLVGPSDMMTRCWGSLLVAYLIRLVVLRIGGAASVRDKLVPAAVGVFLASVAALGIAYACNAYLFFFAKTVVKFAWLI